MKLKQRWLHRLGILLLLFPFLANAYPLPNLYQVKQILIKYHASGQYDLDIHDVTQRAMGYVECKVAKNNEATHPKKLAAIFDIDETSLSNYPAMVKMNFGGTPKAIADQEMLANDPAIFDILKLYNFTKEKGVTVFFVTGRAENQRQATIKNLQLAGYQGWKLLVMKPNDYYQASVIPYKSGARKKIIAMGYTIILNIGDQESDLKGGYSAKTFKLPNPYYYIP